YGWSDRTGHGEQHVALGRLSSGSSSVPPATDMADFVRLKQDDDRGAMLSPALHAAANALCERLRSAGAGSFMATEAQHAALATSFGRPLPQWLSALLQNYSLCGAELFWQAYPPEDDFNGRSYITLADSKRIAVESVELTPGCEILPLGFVCIAADALGPALTQQAVSTPSRPVQNERRCRRPPPGRRTGTAGERPPAARGSPPAPARDGPGREPPPRGRGRACYKCAQTKNPGT